MKVKDFLSTLRNEAVYVNIYDSRGVICTFELHEWKLMEFRIQNANIAEWSFFPECLRILIS